MGYSWQRIAEELGVTLATASKMVKSCLAEIREQTSESAEELRQVEGDRMLWVMDVLSDRVKRGDLFAIDRFIRASESLRLLIGLNAPAKSIVLGATKNLDHLSDDQIDKILETAKDKAKTDREGEGEDSGPIDAEARVINPDEEKKQGTGEA